MPRPLTGYPTSVGNKVVSVVGHAGPASYTQVSSGTIPVTGGDRVYASEFGMKFFDSVVAMCADDGVNSVLVIPTTDTDDFYGAGGMTSVILRWFVVATGAEVAGAVNLSTKTVRLQAIGTQ